MTHDELIDLLDEHSLLRQTLQTYTQHEKGWLFRFPKELDDIIRNEMKIHFKEPDEHHISLNGKLLLIVYNPFRKNERGEEIVGADPIAPPTVTMPRLTRN